MWRRAIVALYFYLPAAPFAMPDESREALGTEHAMAVSSLMVLGRRRLDG
jgi:hypothetical protein